MFSSIRTFDFDLILGSLLTFWGPNGLFLGLGQGAKTVLGSTYVVEQLLFSVVPSIMTFDFDFSGAMLNYKPFWCDTATKSKSQVYLSLYFSYLYFLFSRLQINVCLNHIVLMYYLQQTFYFIDFQEYRFIDFFIGPSLTRLYSFQVVQ